MRKALLILLSVMIVGCNDNWKTDKGKIKVTVEAIRLWPGTTMNYQILSSGDFSVTSSDTTIVQAEIDNKTLTVKAEGIGCTELIIRGKRYDNLKLSVFTILDGLYTEEHETDGCAPKISVSANSEEIAQTIINELNTKMSAFNYVHYHFDSDSKFKLELRDDMNTTYVGTFDWDGKKLVLNYDNKSETYSFRGIYNGARPYMFSATLDLTEEYSKLYPDAGIKIVSVERFITAIPPFYYGAIDNGRE